LGFRKIKFKHALIISPFLKKGKKTKIKLPPQILSKRKQVSFWEIAKVFQRSKDREKRGR